MLAIRSLLPCARQCFLHSATSKNLLFNSSLKTCNAKPFFLRSQSSFSDDNESFGPDSLNPIETRIYYGTLAPRMKAVKVFSLTTSLTGLAVQPMLLEQGMKIGGTGMAIALCTFAGFFTFVTPLLLHFITKKYVTEIHYNSQTDEYTATTVSLLLYKIKTKFRASDVTVPDVPGMFTSFKVGDKPLFVDPVLFKDTDHYIKIMGFDRPIDFKLSAPEENPIQEEVKQESQCSIKKGGL